MYSNNEVDGLISHLIKKINSTTIIGPIVDMAVCLIPELKISCSLGLIKLVKACSETDNSLLFNALVPKIDEARELVGISDIIEIFKEKKTSFPFHKKLISLIPEKLADPECFCSESKWEECFKIILDPDFSDQASTLISLIVEIPKIPKKIKIIADGHLKSLSSTSFESQDELHVLPKSSILKESQLQKKINSAEPIVPQDSHIGMINQSDGQRLRFMH